MTKEQARLVVRMDINFKKQMKLKALILDQPMEEIAKACIWDAFKRGDHHIEKLLQNYKKREV